MIRDPVKLARLLDDLVVAKTIYDLVKRGHNPSTAYRALRWLVEYGFVNVVERNGVRYYHLTSLGARLLKVLREAVLRRVTRELEERGVEYDVWWGDEKHRAVKPVVYVKKRVDLNVNTEDLIEIRVAGDEAN